MTSTKTDHNAQMHNTLSDLFTCRLSCEQTEMILENYVKENNNGSDFCMRMQQTDSVRFYDEPYHKKIASKHIKQRKLQSVGTSVQTQQSFCYSQEQWVILCGCTGCSKFSVRRCHEVILACQRVKKSNQVYI